MGIVIYFIFVFITQMVGCTKITLCTNFITLYHFILGGSLCLVVMVGDSCSKGRGFKSQHHILEGHFSHLFVVKLVLYKTKINQKEAGDGPLKIISINFCPSQGSTSETGRNQGPHRDVAQHQGQGDAVGQGEIRRHFW